MTRCVKALAVLSALLALAVARPASAQVQLSCQNNTCVPIKLVALSPVSLAGQTAAITTANLIGSVPPGQYEVTVYMPSTLVCATPGAAQVVLTLGWTDETGARTQTVTQALGTTTGLSNTVIPIFVSGFATNITYATAVTACTAGTATYSLRLAAKQVQ